MRRRSRRRIAPSPPLPPRPFLFGLGLAGRVPALAASSGAGQAEGCPGAPSLALPSRPWSRTIKVESSSSRPAEPIADIGIVTSEHAISTGAYFVRADCAKGRDAGFDGASFRISLSKRLS
jgi:hypothetical protein